MTKKKKDEEYYNDTSPSGDDLPTILEDIRRSLNGVNNMIKQTAHIWVFIGLGVFYVILFYYHFIAPR